MKTSYMWVDPGLPRDHPITGVSLPLGEALESMKTSGFDGIELMIGKPSDFDVRTFERAVEAGGLEVSQICTGELFGSYGLALNHPDPALRGHALRDAETCVRMAGRWRCSVGIGRFRGNIRDSDPRASLARLAESLSRLDRTAGEEGVTILIEPLRPDTCDTLNTVAETVAAIESWGLEHFGWLLDTDHVDLGQAGRVRREAGTLGFVHFADTRHVALGEGVIDFPAYVRLVEAAGYRGYCGVEVFSGESADERDIIAGMAGKLGLYLADAQAGGGNTHACRAD